MQVIKTDAQIAREEEIQKKHAELKALEQKLLHKKFTETDAKEYTIKIIDEEMSRLNDNSLISAELSVEERGLQSLANAKAYQVLLDIKKRIIEG